MATHRTKSGVASGRKAAARATQSRTAGKRAPESKRSDSDEKMPDLNSDANARSSRGESALRVKPRDDQHDSSSERNSTRGSRWERSDDDPMLARPDDPGGDDGPLADSDEAPEGSER